VHKHLLHSQVAYIVAVNIFKTATLVHIYTYTKSTGTQRLKNITPTMLFIVSLS